MKLARREKYFVMIGAATIALVFLLESLIFPFFDKRERLQRGIQVKEAGLAEILKMTVEYQTYQRDAQGLQQLVSGREKGFTLFAFLEKVAAEAGVKERINYMKPSTAKGTGSLKESLVEMKLDGVTLQQLADYLYRIESPQLLITVKRVSIKENAKESGYLEAVLQASTYEQ